MRRAWNVAAMHLVNRWGWVGLPWVILGAAFTLTYAIWIVLVRVADAGIVGLFSGAALSIVLYEAVLAAQAVTIGFPLALGLNATRREFATGTALAFLVVASANAAALTVLAVLESATDGWGLGGVMFRAMAAPGDDPVVRFLGYLAVQLLFAAVGAALATVYLRWRTTGTAMMGIALGAVGVIAFTAVTLADGWDEIGGWFGAAQATAVYGWMLLIAAVAGGIGWLVLRRATARA